ncbi:basic-leucine zipper transcription factor [Phycomyces blakesleeanus]
MQNENTLNVQTSWNLNDGALDLLNDAIVSHNRTQQKINDNGFSAAQSTLATESDKDKEESDTLSGSNKAGLSKRVFDTTDQADELSNSAAKRPGRKPLDETMVKDDLDPKQKRKAQNRAAQRAFRERKEQRVNELLLKIRELEEAYNSKDIQLAKENLILKEQLRQLEQENLALKDAQQNENTSTTSTTSTTNISTNTSMASETKPKSEIYPISYSESSAEDCMNSSSSDSYSPQSQHNQDEEDISSSTNTPVTFPLASTEIRFNNIQPFQDFDFLSLPNNQAVDSTLSELLHGKGDLFSTYREPVDDNWIYEDSLKDLFGPESDLFGFTAPAPHPAPEYSSADYNALVDKYIITPEYQELKVEDKRTYLAHKIGEANRSGKPRGEIHNELIECPDFNLDLLCKEMKEKARCDVLKKVPMTEYEVKAYVDSFQPFH